MRQTIRLDEVRAPRSVDDRLAPDAVTAVDGSAQTLADHYNGVLTQIRNILGTATWRDAPLNDLAALNAARTQTASTLSSQAQNLAALAREIDGQASALSALQAATQGVLQAQALIQSLQRTVDSLAKTTVDAEAVRRIAGQVAALETQVNGSVAALTSQIGALSNQVDIDRARLDALVANAGQYVTTSGLKSALVNSLVVGATLTGVRNGSNLVFTAPSGFLPQTLTVFYNGQAIRQGDGADYVVDSSNSALPFVRIRLVHPEAAPSSADVLTATYIPA